MHFLFYFLLSFFLSFFFSFFPVFPSFFLCHLCISMSKIRFIINMLSQKITPLKMSLIKQKNCTLQCQHIKTSVSKQNNCTFQHIQSHCSKQKFAHSNTLKKYSLNNRVGQCNTLKNCFSKQKSTFQHKRQELHIPAKNSFLLH